MKCPFCSHEETKVTDKRESPEGFRRRRECLKCNKRFTTYEKIDRGEFFVIKKDGRREKFDREKLKRGIQRAFEKRPVSQEQIDIMLHNIEENLRKKGKEVKSNTIGEIVMKKIEKMDKVAYVRFASVYKDFQDIKDFRNLAREISESDQKSKR